MGTQYRNSFNAGVQDPLLRSRPDNRKWRSSLVTGDNVILLPQGGVKRRPGSKYVATYDAGTFIRLHRFRVGYDVQYLLVFRSMIGDTVASMDVYSSNDVLLTSVQVPYTALRIEGMGFAQEADTMIIFHPDVAPHRLLRSTLAANPLSTLLGSQVVTVHHLSHGLIDGDEIGISGAADTGGIPASALNAQQVVTQIDGSVEANGMSVTSLATPNVVTAHIIAHGFVSGESVEFKGLLAISDSGGAPFDNEVIPASDLNRVQKDITVVDADHVKFTVPTKARTTATGGGSDGLWSAPDKYTISVPLADAATSPVAGGGGSVLVWSLTSIEPNDPDHPEFDRKIALKNLPKFDFRDGDSPAPSNEVQRLIFSKFGAGDVFRMTVQGIRSGKLFYEANFTEFAGILQTTINVLARRTGIVVEYEGQFTVGGDTEERYRVTFDGDAAGVNWDPITVSINSSVNGIFTNEAVSEGGSTAEPVISEVRGWPRHGIFHQRRLWMVSPKSRPLTVLGSVTEDFFNFNVGDAQPNDAIDTTGEFDPIRFIVLGATGFHLITTGSVVTMKPDRDTGGYIPPLAFDPGENFGGGAVQPVIFSGRPTYVDTINRSIRQLRADQNGDLISAEISLYSQHLIEAPIRLEQLRAETGDYLYVTNAGDGSMAILCLDVPQQVQGWTRFVTRGTYLDSAEVSGFMYAAVARLNGIMLEKFDPDYFTDCGRKVTAALTDAWSGFEHLSGEPCDVRGDGATLDAVTPGDDGLVTTLAAAVSYPVQTLEVGIPFDVTIEPTPLSIGQRTRMVEAVIDLLDTQSEGLKVDGFPLVTRTSGSLVNPPALVTGFFNFRLRGWKQNATVSITQRAPQPLLLRGVELTGLP